MAGAAVALEALESDVAAKAAVAANRRTDTRNNFFILGVLPYKTKVERSYQKNSSPANQTNSSKIAYQR
jgi:hypothetical protein